MSQSKADGVNSYRGWSRRRRLAMAAIVSAAVIGGLLLVPGFVKPRMNAEELSNTALNWIDLLDDKTWNADLSAAPKHLRISTRLSARPNRWQIWQTPPPLNEKSIAYQLISPIAREKAVLFVTERPNRIQNLTTTPPAEPLAGCQLIGGAHDDPVANPAHQCVPPREHRKGRERVELGRQVR